MAHGAAPPFGLLCPGTPINTRRGVPLRVPSRKGTPQSSGGAPITTFAVWTVDWCTEGGSRHLNSAVAPLISHTGGVSTDGVRVVPCAALAREPHARSAWPQKRERAPLPRLHPCDPRTRVTLSQRRATHVALLRSSTHQCRSERLGGVGEWGGAGSTWARVEARALASAASGVCQWMVMCHPQRKRPSATGGCAHSIPAT